MEIVMLTIGGMFFLAGYGLTLRFLSSLFGEEKA
ncbi:hypothetical protein Arcve_0673 [Archaeoglobus veneficus SNP6]|uniref:Uncharacterized protein n=1 Tax=Archaeoglobus veneficus (strain DSM 11195 / SNP6) TaxID=693661 RepID=F2KR56_ARCVS|nr:hypothetical protein Arcve_0673 [Archaeoglobus veneficus SNP6]